MYKVKRFSKNTILKNAVRQAKENPLTAASLALSTTMAINTWRNQKQLKKLNKEKLNTLEKLSEGKFFKKKSKDGNNTTIITV